MKPLLSPPKTLVSSAETTQITHFTKSAFDALPNCAYVREAQLVQSPTRPDSTAPLPFSAPTLWRKVKAGTFPKPTKLSERVTAWNVGAVRAWLLAREAA